jgi:hypothetical protein
MRSSSLLRQISVGAWRWRLSPVPALERVRHHPHPHVLTASILSHCSCTSLSLGLMAGVGMAGGPSTVVAGLVRDHPQPHVLCQPSRHSEEAASRSLAISCTYDVWAFSRSTAATFFLKCFSLILSSLMI